MSSGRLVVVRHGESEWNAEGIWTGSTDVHLSAKGFYEAALLGELIRDIPLDEAFCSQQIRSLETLEGMLNASGQYEVPYSRVAAINERDYGIYTGKNKWQVKRKIGQVAFDKLRRGWNELVPDGETLKDVYERVVPFYRHTVVPLLIAKRNILLVAHGNSIRSLVKYIEHLSDKQIEDTEMIFGTTLIYTVDKTGRQTSKQERSISAKKT